MATPFEEANEGVVREILGLCAQRGATFATAESCTGGLVGGAVTAVPGASDGYRGGVVSYANEVKRALLGVREDTLARHGAVSAECAAEMVAGACAALEADYAVATTGIAGPGGATPDKPVGLVFIAAARRGRAATVTRNVFPGNRDEVRRAAVAAALALLLSELKREP